MITVTGATGRIGRRLLAALSKGKEPVCAIVRSRESVEKLPKGAKWRLASLSTGAGLRDALADTDKVVNLAGAVGTHLPEHELFISNVTSTSHLFTSLPATVQRVVHISSIAIYGKKPACLPADEFCKPQPDSAYAKTKWGGELVARAHAARFPVTVLRPAIVCGPEFSEGFFPVISALEKGSMKIIGSGENHVPLVHVNDVVSAIVSSLHSSKKGLSTYNISAPPEKTLTQEELFTLAAKALRVPPPNSHISYPAAKLTVHFRSCLLSLFGRKSSLTSDMIGQLYYDRVFDISQATRELGWFPKIGLKEGVLQTVKAYKEWKHGQNKRVFAE